MEEAREEVQVAVEARQDSEIKDLKGEASLNGEDSHIGETIDVNRLRRKKTMWIQSG